MKRQMWERIVVWYVIGAAGPNHSLKSNYSSLIDCSAQVMNDETLSIFLSMYWQWRPAPHCWGDLEWGCWWMRPLQMSGEWKHHSYRAWLWWRALAHLWTRGWAHHGHHWQGVLLLKGDLWYVPSWSCTVSSCHKTCMFTTIVKKWVCMTLGLKKKKFEVTTEVFSINFTCTSSKQALPHYCFADFANTHAKLWLLVVNNIQ